MLFATNKLPFHARDTRLYAGDSYPLQLRLKPQKTTFKKSEFVRIEAEARNVADYTVDIPWNTCGDIYKIILDREHNILGEPGLVCGIGGGISPGQKTRGAKLLELDLSHLETGKHVISMEYADPNIKSNEIEIELTPADPIYDCHSYTADITTLCHQIMIRSNVNASGPKDNTNCRRIKDKFLSKSYPLVNPIPTLSTENCDEGIPAVFVFNVPYKEHMRFNYEVENAKDADIVCRTTAYSSKWISRIPSRFDCF